MAKDLTTLLSPKTVAVIGASRHPQKVGAIVLKNILDSGFPGQVYPVNPQAEKINNLKCYPDIKNLPKAVDLAILAIPAAQTLTVLNQIGEKGIQNAVVLAAGFKEIGNEGEKLEKELIEIAKRFKLNILGPNCLGFVNNLCPINASFGQPALQPGNLRFISQSGAIAASLFDWCREIKLGFSHFVSLGNKAVLNENDFLEYFQNKSQKTLTPIDQKGLSYVRPIGLYLESISDGKKFLDLMSQISQTDPIFILKPGKTLAAAQAMQSHTGALAGEDEVLDAVLQQAGAIRCETLQDFFDLARALAWENAPAGPKVAIVSNAGGPAVVSADAVVKEGLELAKFDTQTQTKLSQVLPRSANILNPIDVLGDALSDRFAKACEIILQKNAADALVIILTPQLMTQIGKTAQIIGELSQKYQQPIFCSFMGGSLVAEGEKLLNEYKVPTFAFPEQAIAAVGALWRFKKHPETPVAIGPKQTLMIQPNLAQIQEIIAQASKNQQKILDNFQANQLISSIWIPTPPTQAVSDLKEAQKIAQTYGWPVVLKLSSPGLLHKKEIGGVFTDLGNREQLEIAWNKLERKISQLEAIIRGSVKIQIQKDILDGVEVLMGVKQDSTFGPVLLFGAGGSLTELIADRNLHLLPVEIPQAQRLVKKSKIFSALKGEAGEPAYALDKLYAVVVRLGKLATLVPEILEIEINPAIVTLNDVWAVDTKVILKPGQLKPATPPQFQVATAVSREIPAGNFHFFAFATEKPLLAQPGQYITVKVAQNRINCYSIAGQENSHHFNLLVDITPGGLGSKFFENLKVGDKIAFLGPFGVFTLKPNDGAKRLLFLGTGCGLSPLKRMIETTLIEQKLQTPIHLYLGLNYPQDVFWQDYFDKLTRQYPNFSYKIVIWKPDKNWRGFTGFITDFVKKDFPNTRECTAYLCGSQPMIESATKLLLETGCPKERIYTEKL